jgi:hypothetical protein
MQHGFQIPIDSLKEYERLKKHMKYNKYKKLLKGIIKRQNVFGLI